MNQTRAYFLAAALAGLAALAGAQEDHSTVFDIPLLENIVIDGQGDDWGSGGLHVDDIRRYGAPAPSTAIAARLGWSPQGLLCLVRVSDAAGSGAFGVELSLSARCGDSNILQWVVQPPDAGASEPRKTFHDLRQAPELKVHPVGLRCATGRGAADGKGIIPFTYEILLPWEGLGIRPSLNREMAVQLVILDGHGGLRNVWYQGKDLHPWPDNMQRVRLCRAAGARDVFQVSRFAPNVGARVIGLGIVRRSEYPCGGDVNIVSDGRVLKTVRHTGGRSDVQVPLPPLGSPYTNLVFEVGAEKLGQFALNTDDLYFEAMQRRRLGFSEYVFSGDAFPGCDFTDAGAVKQVLPDYEVKTRFFDAGFNEVTRPNKPGRYGAVVSFGNKAATRKRYVTLFKTLPPAGAGDDLAVRTGISPELVAAYQGAVAEALQKRKAEHAVTLALLQDRSAGVGTRAFVLRPEAREKQWWAQLRHTLGEDVSALSPYPFTVITPRGYDESKDRAFGLILYCPGRARDSEGTWDTIDRHPAVELFRGPAAEPCPFLVCIPHSFRGYTPEELLQILDSVALRYRVDPRKVYAVGRDSDADPVRFMAARYPGRLAAAVRLEYGGAVHAVDLSGTAGDTPEYSRRGRDAELADPPRFFTKQAYEWLAGLSKPQPGEAVKADPLPKTVRRVQAAAAAPVKPAKFIEALKAGKPQTLVAMGTSLTAGGAWVEQVRVELDKRFPGLVKMLNYGASGRNGGTGLGSVGSVVGVKADAVFIEYSINDAKDAQMSTDAARDTFERTIDGIRKGLPECEIFPMTMNCCEGGAAERRPTLQEFYQVYRDVAKEKGLPCIDHYANWVRIWEEDPDLYSRYIPDGCHPGGEGCRTVIVPEILRAIGF